VTLEPLYFSESYHFELRRCFWRASRDERLDALARLSADSISTRFESAEGFFGSGRLIFSTGSSVFSAIRTDEAVDRTRIWRGRRDPLDLTFSFSDDSSNYYS